MDGTAAVFGVISAALALTIAFLAVKGLSNYRELLERIEEDVKQRLEQNLENRVTIPAVAKVQSEVDKAISERIRDAIVTAETSLAQELQRLSQEEIWRDQFTEEIVKRVQELVQPRAKEISTSEFDDPHADS